MSDITTKQIGQLTSAVSVGDDDLFVIEQNNIAKKLPGSALVTLLGGKAMTEDVKTALLNCFQHVAWTVPNGEDYYNALSLAMNTKTVVGMTAVYTQTGTVYDTDSLDSLKSDLVVTLTYDDASTETVPSNAYTLSGTLTVGTSTITVTYGDYTDTFDVTVSLPTRSALFGELRTGVSIKHLQPSGTPKLATYLVTASQGNARAVIPAPILNRNFIISPTDTTKYEIIVAGVTNTTKMTTSVPSDSADGFWYQGDDKNIAWGAEKGVSTAEYIWLGLNKIDGTAFTDEELANSGEAIFSYTMDGIGLDSIAYGELTYRDMFITNNLTGWFGDFESHFSVSSSYTYSNDTYPHPSGYRKSPNTSADPTVDTSEYSSFNHSVKFTASGSNVYMNAYATPTQWATPYIVAFSCNISSYTSGKMELQIFGDGSVVIRDIRTSATDGWQSVIEIGTPIEGQSGELNINFGALGDTTYGNANLTGYMDDLVVTPLPDGMTQEQALALYNNYLKIRRGEIVTGG